MRVEGSKAAIFTNDEKLVDAINVKLKEFVTELHSPKSKEQAEFLHLNKNKVICKLLPHEKYRYKLYFKTSADMPLDMRGKFVNWADRYTNDEVLIPLGARSLLESDRVPYFYGQYFYVKDQKLASMALMFIGDFISKTETFVLESEV